ncbi:MAG: ATP-binding protein [Planctomycetota bacterium]|nr:ATP-binding protein [Planctomycetota bacterium]
MIGPVEHSGGAGEGGNTSSAGRIELKISSDPANLRGVRRQLEDFARFVGMSQEATDAIGLALNEALANVMRHGYSGARDKPIVVAGEIINGGFRLTIRDWAPPFDPSRLPKKDRADLTPGGLGLLCIRKLMDETNFSPQPDGMLLTMVKHMKATK